MPGSEIVPKVFWPMVSNNHPVDSKVIPFGVIELIEWDGTIWVDLSLFE